MIPVLCIENENLLKINYFTILYVFIFYLIESFVLHNCIEINVGHSQQTTSIFLIGTGIQNLIFDMMFQKVGSKYQRPNVVMNINETFYQLKRSSVRTVIPGMC